MRASLLALLVLGCREDAAPKPAPTTPDTGPNAMTAAFGQDEVKLTWGVATYRPAGLEIRIASQHIACADLDKQDASGTQLAFSVPPGPEGKFYAQSAIGVSVVVAHAGKRLPVPTDESTLALEGFTPLVAGARVKGKLVAATHVDGTNLMASGTFDVEVCAAPATPVRALRSDAPTTPAAGTFEGGKLEAKTVQAIVKTRAQRGPYVARLVFYEKANVPCPKDDKGAATDVMFVVKEFATRKSKTPAEGMLVRIEPAAEIAFDAWVMFDNAAFETGEHITGSLWAQPAFQWEGKGDFGGTFEANVCAL